jgi:hypothetical protein
VAPGSPTATTAGGQDWVASNTRVLKHKTVMYVNGKKRLLPRAGLRQLR